MTGTRGWWLGAAGLLMAGIVALGVAVVSPIQAAYDSSPVPPRPSPSPPVLAYAADSLARIALARPVFRSGRRAAGVSYEPARATQPTVESRAPKPVLMLVGLVAGAEPAAVVEGFPRIDGARVVRVGDLVSGLKIQRIADNEVRIAGLDTVWVLRVREPWK